MDIQESQSDIDEDAGVDKKKKRGSKDTTKDERKLRGKENKQQ